MGWNPFQSFLSKSFLGVDVGTSFIKIAEVSQSGQRINLENYGEISSSVFHKQEFRGSNSKNALVLSDKEIIQAAKAILSEAKMKSRKAIFSIPDFSTFFTTIELPKMSDKELPEAIKYEARQHIPVSLSEVALDWQKVKEEKGKSGKIKVIVVAVSNEVIKQYENVAKGAGLELMALEPEAFSLIRSLIKEESKEVAGIMDIGARSTVCNIVEGISLKRSYSFDCSGEKMDEAISKSLNVGRDEAKSLKKKCGISFSEEGSCSESVSRALLPLIDEALNETERSFNNFYNKEGKSVNKLFLAGGLAHLAGLEHYSKKKIGIEIELANPFFQIGTPPVLEKTLEEMGPSYAVATGAALRGFQL